MRILVLGGSGLLGHSILQRLSRGHEVLGALRGGPGDYPPFFPSERLRFGIDLRDHGRLRPLLEDFRPDVVVNAVGIVKQRLTEAGFDELVTLNSSLPHRLAELCGSSGARLLNFSTDCVFSGRGGGYSERHPPDPVDAYGASKWLGEVDRPGCLTLRTSFVGCELGSSRGLLEWFLRAKGRVLGYRKALYTGLTTFEVSRVIQRILESFADLSGIRHLTGPLISKFELLSGFARSLERTDVEVVPDDAVEIDRSLDGSRLARELGYAPPPWATMLAELAEAIRARGPIP